MGEQTRKEYPDTPRANNQGGIPQDFRLSYDSAHCSTLRSIDGRK